MVICRSLSPANVSGSKFLLTRIEAKCTGIPSVDPRIPPNFVPRQPDFGWFQFLEGVLGIPIRLSSSSQFLVVSSLGWGGVFLKGRWPSLCGGGLLVGGQLCGDSGVRTCFRWGSCAFGGTVRFDKDCARLHRWCNEEFHTLNRCCGWRVIRRSFPLV